MLVLDAATALDAKGGTGAQTEISMIKLAVARTGPVAVLCRSFDSIHCNRGD